MKQFIDENGARWCAELVSHGRTSSYLNPRVHGAIVQFSCLDARRPSRYVGYHTERDGPLEDLPDAELSIMLARSSTH